MIELRNEGYLWREFLRQELEEELLRKPTPLDKIEYAAHVQRKWMEHTQSSVDRVQRPKRLESDLHEFFEETKRRYLDSVNTEIAALGVVLDRIVVLRYNLIRLEAAQRMIQGLFLPPIIESISELRGRLEEENVVVYAPKINWLRNSTDLAALINALIELQFLSPDNVDKNITPHFLCKGKELKSVSLNNLRAKVRNYENAPSEDFKGIEEILREMASKRE